MNIEWEDRKKSGHINGVKITSKPNLSFEFAWLLINSATAQFAPSHDNTSSNLMLNEDQILEVEEYVLSWEPPAQKERSIEDLKQDKLNDFKSTRESFELTPVNGISVGKESHRSDLKEYAALLRKFESATEEERIQYSGLINEDGSINWTLADNTVRPVTAKELEDTYQYFFIRKGVLMGAYQSAIKQLYDQSVQTVEQINAITLEV